MVEPQPSKLMVWVRFPSPAPVLASQCREGLDRLVPAAAPLRKASNYAHVAQSVEHVLGKDEVTGSIPVVGSSQSQLMKGKRLIR